MVQRQATQPILRKSVARYQGQRASNAATMVVVCWNRRWRLGTTDDGQVYDIDAVDYLPLLELLFWQRTVEQIMD